MEWTPEAVRAAMDHRYEDARQHELVRQLRESGRSRPTWWRRLRSHADPDDGERRDQAA